MLISTKIDYVWREEKKKHLIDCTFDFFNHTLFTWTHNAHSKYGYFCFKTLFVSWKCFFCYCFFFLCLFYVCQLNFLCSNKRTTLTLTVVSNDSRGDREREYTIEYHKLSIQTGRLFALLQCRSYRCCLYFAIVKERKRDWARDIRPNIDVTLFEVK